MCDEMTLHPFFINPNSPHEKTPLLIENFMYGWNKYNEIRYTLETGIYESQFKKAAAYTQQYLSPYKDCEWVKNC